MSEAENTEGSDHREARRMQAAEYLHSRLLVFFFFILCSDWMHDLYKPTVSECLERGDVQMYSQLSLPPSRIKRHLSQSQSPPDIFISELCFLNFRCDKVGVGLVVFLFEDTPTVTPLFGRKMCNSEGLYILLLFLCRT